MKNKSFTLIEILVAVAVFSIIIGIASGLFFSTIRAQRKSLAQQQLLNQTSYVMEYISRALRMAKKDLTGDCITAKLNYENPGGDLSKIRFIKFDYKEDKDICQEFFQDGNQLKERKSTDNTAASFEDPLPLTSTSTIPQINSIKFQLSGEGQADNFQPRITIFLAFEGKEQSNIQIQTTISQRNPDIEK